MLGQVQQTNTADAALMAHRDKLFATAAKRAQPCFGPNMAAYFDLWSAHRPEGGIPLRSRVMHADLSPFEDNILVITFPEPDQVMGCFAYGNMFDWNKRTSHGEDLMELFDLPSRDNAFKILNAMRRLPCGFYGRVDHHSVVGGNLDLRNFLALPLVTEKGAFQCFLSVDDPIRVIEKDSEEDRDVIWPAPGRTRFGTLSFFDVGYGVPGRGSVTVSEAV